MASEEHNKSEQAKLFATDFNKKVGKVIRKHRKYKRYSLDYMAAVSDICPSTISRYETGKKSIPVPVMAYMSHFFDYDIGEYFVDQDTKKSMSTIFKEAVRYGTGAKKVSIPKPSKADKEFDEYISKPENITKQILLSTVDMILTRNSSDKQDPGLQAIMMSVTNYVASDIEEGTRQRLLAYYERCKHAFKEGKGIDR